MCKRKNCNYISIFTDDGIFNGRVKGFVAHSPSPFEIADHDDLLFEEDT